MQIGWAKISKINFMQKNLETVSDQIGIFFV